VLQVFTDSESIIFFFEEYVGINKLQYNTIVFPNRFGVVDSKF